MQDEREIEELSESYHDDMGESALSEEIEDSEIEGEFPVSAEPELVAEFSADVKIPEPEDPTPHLTSTVCDVCLELNLTHKDQIITCSHCEQAFCFHYASSVDAQYCVNCMSDINVQKNTISKEYIHRDEQGGVTSVYRRKAREVKIGGLSWLFAQRKITELSDVELDMAIEYHRNILSLMISEQEQRRNTKMHRYAGIKAIPTPTTTKVSDDTTTSVRKTRTISKTKAEEQLAAVMKAKGVDMAALLKILNAGK